ncbi:MAG: galactokinase [Bacteroidales bacterium]|nr:galactokinase [Bacteroidales bacterium]
MDITDLKKQFIALYGGDETGLRVFFCPGRVNLIGEHTDYNGGMVFPCALSFGTYLVIRPSGLPALRFASTNFDFKATVELDAITEKLPGGACVNYPLGVINELLAAGLNPSGQDLLYAGNIPNGAGLSSSASIEVLTAYAFNELYGLGLDRIELVKASQRAENRFVGVNCGIMDQFAVGLGRKDAAIRLKCDTLEYELVPVVLGDYRLIIANTNKRRGLADSKYNERRGECDQAVEELSKAGRIEFLCELSVAEFEKRQHLISSDVIRARARHAVSENERVKVAVQELKAGNLKAFGALMNASHDSLRDDYEVTGIELDTLVAEARKIDGVIGSRMTGAGFGGCTVSLIHKDAIADFKEKVAANYTAATGLVPDFYVAEIGDGAKEILS